MRFIFRFFSLGIVFLLAGLCVSKEATDDTASKIAGDVPTPQTAKRIISSTDTAISKPSDKASDMKALRELEVVELDSRNLRRNLSDGNVWLINFYSPSCGHCVDFEAFYADIAKQYHSNRALKLKVGRINGKNEYALVSRFRVEGYPSFFIVDGWRVYHYQQARTKKLLMSYAEGGYKSTDSIPFYFSPMGPLGLLQDRLLWSGHAFIDVFNWMQHAWGLPPILVGSFLFGTMFLGLFFFIVFLALVIPPRQKVD